MRSISSTTATLKRTALASTAIALALTVGGYAAHAAPIPVTYDPGVFATGAASFTADKLNLLQYTRVDLGATTGGQTSFSENGLLEVNNVSLNNNTFNPPGNRSAYTLYFQFSGTGTQSAPNFTGGSQGSFNGLAYTLYGVNGASSFGIDPSNNPFVNPNGTTTTLATGSLINGTTTFSASPLGAGANINATFVEQLAGFIASPANATLTLAGAFNTDQNIVNVFNNGTSFSLNGGGGDITFTATVPPPPVPEPATLALLGTGLVGLSVFSRRRKSN